MSRDTIALFRRADGEVEVGFFIGGSWWKLYEDKRVRRWASADDALLFLKATEEHYFAKYGDLLGWNVDDIPVVH